MQREQQPQMPQHVQQMQPQPQQMMDQGAVQSEARGRAAFPSGASERRFRGAREQRRSRARAAPGQRRRHWAAEAVVSKVCATLLEHPLLTMSRGRITDVSVERAIVGYKLAAGASNLGRGPWRTVRATWRAWMRAQGKRTLTVRKVPISAKIGMTSTKIARH